ncbi:MAG: restriction endonuclease subunit S [Rhizobiaceae bacterium]|nr:restriction endonuclease subunit S [Rhizobiaceae bacterium]
MSSERNVYQLDEVYDFRSGLSKPRSAFGSGHPFLTFKDVFYNFFVPKKLGDLVETSEKERSVGDIRRGDVFLTRTSETQHELGMSCVALSDVPNGTFNGFCKRLRPKAQAQIIPEYAGYYFRSPDFRESMSAISTLSTRASLNEAMLAQLEITLPDTDVQKSIGIILKCLDDKIELLREMNRTLEEIARAVFRAWFVDFDPVRAKAAGATSFRGMPQDLFDTLPNSYELSEIGEIPTGWVPCVLSDLIAVNPTRPLKKGVESAYLGMTDVPTSGPTPDSWAQREFSSGMRFKNGDTLLARITPCLENGKTALVDFLDNGEIGWGSTEFIVLAPKGSTSREFIYCLARNERFREFAIKNMTGTSGRQRVSHESISGYKMVDPGAAALEVFEQLSEPMFDRITANRDEISTLAALRDTLLPKLISGELEAPSLEALGLDGGE